MLTAPTELWMPAGTHQRPPPKEERWSPQKILLNGRSLARPTWEWPVGTKMVAFGEHWLPTTLGRQAQDSPHQVPSPWMSNQKLLNPIWHGLFLNRQSWGGGGHEGPAS